MKQCVWFRACCLIHSVSTFDGNSAFWNQTAHIACARSATHVGKSGQATGKSAKFPPWGFQQILLSDVCHSADKAPGSVDLWESLPKPRVTSLGSLGLCLPFTPPPSLNGGELKPLHLPSGSCGPARGGFHGTGACLGTNPLLKFTLKILFWRSKKEDLNVKQQCSFLYESLHKSPGTSIGHVCRQTDSDAKSMQSKIPASI